MKSHLPRQTISLALLIAFLTLTYYYWVTQKNSNVLQTTAQNCPAQRILFIGNSRTDANNLPSILENIIDCATSPYHYETVSYTPGGYTFEEHYSSPAVHHLLNQKWDYVILQGGSPENTNPDSRQAFIHYGQKLIHLAQQQHSLPVLFVAWTYDQNSYESENEYYLKPYYQEYAANYQAYINTHGSPPQDRVAPESFFPLDIEKHFEFIQSDYHTLSGQTNAQIVNVGQAFLQLLASNPRFHSLTSDGNHPNLQGSYLAAVMFHVCFSKTPAHTISYVPSGLSHDDALAIRTFIDQYYPDGICERSSF